MRSATGDCFSSRNQSLLLDKLCQHPGARFGMDKRDAPTVRADARRRIDQANTRRRQLIQAGPEIRHGVRNMMHSLAALGQITRDRTVRVRWSNELDPACPRAKRRYLDRLFGKHEPFTAGKPKQSVTHKCLIEVGHDNRNMMQHGIDVQRQGRIGIGH